MSAGPPEVGRPSAPALFGRRPFSDQVVRLGFPPRPFADLYHWLLDASWGRTVLVVLGLYLALNLVFATLYLAGGNAIENARPGNFGDAFFFSVQTMATIGYGKMTPRGVWADALVSVEALTGMLYTAMATGLMFSKFARPTARVMFSAPICIARRDGVRSAFFRMANARANQIVEASARLSFARTEVTAEGERVRRFYDLPLTRSSNQIFALTWTAVHAITEASPLFAETPESLAASEAMFIVTLVGLDETLAQTVHARHNYLPQEVAWGCRFVDVISVAPDGRRTIDYTRFHDTQSQDEPALQRSTSGVGLSAKAVASMDASAAASAGGPSG